MLEVLLETYLAGRSSPFAGEAEIASLFSKRKGAYSQSVQIPKKVFPHFKMKRGTEQNRIPIKTEPIPVLTSQ